MLMPSNNKNTDARLAVPGYQPDTVVQSKRQKRSSALADDTAKALTYEHVGADNPLSMPERQKITRALLGAKPEAMVFFPHVKEERQRCAKLSFNNVLQCLLADDTDLIAVANHYMSLLANDPDPKVSTQFEALRASGHQFYDTLEGQYDDHCLLWWSEEFFSKGCFVRVNMADSKEFVRLYNKYSNSALAWHRTTIITCNAPDSSIVLRSFASCRRSVDQVGRHKGSLEWMLVHQWTQLLDGGRQQRQTA